MILVVRVVIVFTLVRRLSQVFFRILVEGRLAAWGTEIIGLALVF